MSYDVQADRDTGLAASYYGTCDRTAPSSPTDVPAGWGTVGLARTDPAVSFDWGTAAPFASLGADDFCVRWTGYVAFPYSASNWQLTVTDLDDGVKIWVNNALYMDQWSDHGGGTYGCTIGNCSLNLYGGQLVPVTIAYMDHAGSASVRLQAAGPYNGDVPAAWLSKTAAPLPDGWRLSTAAAGGAPWRTARISPSGAAVLTSDEGDVEEWPAGTGGLFTAPPWEAGVLRLSGTDLVLEQDGMQWTWNSLGVLIKAVSTADPSTLDLTFGYSTTTGQVTSIVDPLTSRTVTLVYGSRDSIGVNDPNCAQSSSFGATVPPVGRLCKITYAGTGLMSRFYYNGARQLVRVEHPGGEITDYAYDGSGRLTQVRDPLAFDAVTGGQATGDATSTWQIAYDTTTTRPTSLTAPKAKTTDGFRAGHTYEYPASGEARVQVAGFTPPVATPWSSKVTYDNLSARTLTATDAGGRVTATTWNNNDQPLTVVDPPGRKTSTIYDAQGKPTDVWGPAPAAWFTGAVPQAAYVSQTPHTVTGYDGGIVGLKAEFFNSTTPGSVKPAATVNAVGQAPGSNDFYNRWPGSPATGVNADNWSVRMTGTLTMPGAGTYTVNLADDNGGRLYIDDRLVIDDWYPAGGFHWAPTAATIVSGAVGEKHRVQVEVKDTGGEDLLQLAWGGPSVGVLLNALSPNYALATSSTDPDGKANGTVYANPARGTVAASVVDPAGLRLSTATAVDAYGRRTGRRLPANTYQGQVMDDAPWAYWRLNDHGTTAADSSGNNRNVTYDQYDVYNSPRRGEPAGLVADDDPGITYDGSTSQISLPANAVRGFGSAGSIEARIRPTGGGVIAGMNNPAATSYVPVLYVGADGKLRGHIWGMATQLVTAGSVIDGNWHHVALTWGAGGDTLYLDGTAVMSSTGTVDMLDMTENYLGVGKTANWASPPAPNSNGWTYYRGGLDETALYSTKLTAARVTAHYEAASTALAAVTTTYYAGETAPQNTCDIDPNTTGVQQAISVNGLAKSTVEADPDNNAATADAVSRDTVYDTWGRVVGTRTNTGTTLGLWVCTTYDARGRATQVNYPAFGTQAVARNVTTTWSNGGLTSTAADDGGVLVSTVDLHGRTTSSTDTLGNLTTTVYDQAGRASQTGASGVLAATYNTDGTMATQTLDGSTMATPQYTATGEVDYVTYANGTRVDITRNDHGATTTLGWTGPGSTAITSNTVTRSLAGRIATDITDGTQNTYTYDGASRLTVAQLGASRTQTYCFGVAGGSCVPSVAGRNTNRTKLVDTGGVAASYTYDQADRLTAVTGDTRYTGTITHDTHGSMTTIGGASMGYDMADRHTQTVNGATTVAYTRDTLDRITQRKVNGAVVANYGYCGGSDSPCVTLDNANNVLEKVIGLAGGVTLTKASTNQSWGHPNIHGDITAQTDATGAKQGATSLYDPYGQSLTAPPDQLTGNLDYGWLGQNQRPTEHETTFNTIEMGARQYLPGLGRFIETDPIEGGSANDYDYTDGDPVNSFDLNGNAKNEPAGLSPGEKEALRKRRNNDPTYNKKLYNSALRKETKNGKYKGDVNKRKDRGNGGRFGFIGKSLRASGNFAQRVWKPAVATVLIFLAFLAALSRSLASGTFA